jgi:hypothetical protein
MCGALFAKLLAGIPYLIKLFSRGIIDNWADAEGITQLVIRLGLDDDQNNLPDRRR